MATGAASVAAGSGGAHRKLRTGFSHAGGDARRPSIWRKRRKRPRRFTASARRRRMRVGRRCLLARRLVEQGVRFVQVYAGGWDSHDFIEEAHQQSHARHGQTDRRPAEGSEAARHVGQHAGGLGRRIRHARRITAFAAAHTVWGRDHNPTAMSMWFAGGGVRARAHCRRHGRDRAEGRGSGASHARRPRHDPVAAGSG